MRICDCWCTEASAFSNPIGHKEALAGSRAEVEYHLFTRIESEAVNGQALCGVHYIMNLDEAAKKSVPWKHAKACRWADRSTGWLKDRGELCLKCLGVAADKVAAGMKNEEMY